MTVTQAVVLTEERLLVERDAISRALLRATQDFAHSADPVNILHKVCDALVQASSHISLAWMFVGNLAEQQVCPQYIAGPAKAYGESLAIPSSQPKFGISDLQVIEAWQPCSLAMSEQHDEALQALKQQYQLRSLAFLPIGHSQRNEVGIVAVYANLPDYFATAGMDLFSAFAHLGTAALEQKRLVTKLYRTAHRDALTGVLNRHGLRKQLEEEYARAKRFDQSFSIMFFDLDRFKSINDNYGHQIGDEVLIAAAQRAELVIREIDVLGRWGGEEFMCVLPRCAQHGAVQIAERVRVAIEEMDVRYCKSAVSVTASFGIACFPQAGRTLDGLIAAADSALYKAKREGRNRIIAAYQGEQEIVSIGKSLDQALQHDRIVPAYQPIVELKTGQIIAEEAYARIADASAQYTVAADFIAVANRLRLIDRVDGKMWSMVLRRCVEAVAKRPMFSHFVNLSADFLANTDLAREALQQAKTYCASCADLLEGNKPIVLELAERDLVGDIPRIKNLLAPFMEFGFRLSVEDFGSGYASYQYLADLPIHFLKLDRQLIQRLDEPKVRAIVQGICDTSNLLHITTIGSGVEQEHTADQLREIGVHWAQGNYFGEPSVDKPC